MPPVASSGGKTATDFLRVLSSPTITGDSQDVLHSGLTAWKTSLSDLADGEILAHRAALLARARQPMTECVVSLCARGRLGGLARVFELLRDVATDLVLRAMVPHFPGSAEAVTAHTGDDDDVLTYLEHGLTRVGDRAEARRAAARAVVAVLSARASEALTSALADWLARLSRSNKPALRGLAVDVMVELCQAVEAVRAGPKAVAAMTAAVLSRAQDRNTQVRSRAVAAVEPLLPLLPAADSALAPLLVRRASDDKAVVRKAAVGSLAAAERSGHVGSATARSVFVERVRDEALAVRRAALVAAIPAEALWADCVLPCVCDPESSVQDRALEACEAAMTAQPEAWLAAVPATAASLAAMRVLFSRVRPPKRLLAELQRPDQPQRLRVLEVAIEADPKTAGLLAPTFLASAWAHDPRSSAAIVAAAMPSLPAADRERIAREAVSLLAEGTGAPHLVRVAAHCARAGWEAEVIAACVGKPERLFVAGEVALECPAAATPALAVWVQSLLDDSHPAPVRAHAFVALGKLCLSDQALAKRCLPVMVRQLEGADAPDAVRNNVLIVLADLCVRYPALVDRYLPMVGQRLRDGSVFVRRQALAVISRLLTEEYMKWKDDLFYLYLACAVDEDADVRTRSTHLLTATFARRDPELFSHRFVEALFVFNHVAHPTLATCGRGPSLALPADQRMACYRLLLSGMSDEQRFTNTGLLCRDVLGAVVDGLVPFEDATNVLADALALLVCDGIQIAEVSASARAAAASLASVAGAGADDDDAAPLTAASATAAAAAAARSKVIAALIRKNVSENIMPVLVELKHFLERHRSPLLRDLLHALKHFSKEFPKEVMDYLSSDKTLAAEIAFDLRQEEERAAKEALSSTPSPAKPLPSPPKPADTSSSSVLLTPAKPVGSSSSSSTSSQRVQVIMTPTRDTTAVIVIPQEALSPAPETEPAMQNPLARMKKRNRGTRTPKAKEGPSGAQTSASPSTATPPPKAKVRVSARIQLTAN